MKKVIFILICLICSFSLFAQRLNEQGLKMVKEIIYKGYNIKGELSTKKNYLFGYNKGNKMISLDIYKNGELIEAYINENRTFKKYQNYVSDFSKHKFSYDMFGNITSFEYICLSEKDGKTPYWKHIYTFDYDYDGKTRQHRLRRVSDDYSEYKRSTKSYIDISSRVCAEVIDIGGLYIDGSKKEGSGFYLIDYDHPNDTNMSFYGILTSGIGYRSMDFDSLLLTEWINVRSPYFAKYSTDLYKLYFHYDDKGNLIQVEQREHGKLIRVIEIKYYY